VESKMRARGEPFFCPKGTEGLSLGFEPRFPNKRLCSNGWTRNCDPGLSPQEIAHRYLPPFQAGSRFLAFLGLKPQAESYCPFGTMSSTLTRRVVNRQLGAYPVLSNRGRVRERFPAVAHLPVLPLAGFTFHLSLFTDSTRCASGGILTLD
jgi:hypothetical protein